MSLVESLLELLALEDRPTFLAVRAPENRDDKAAIGSVDRREERFDVFADYSGLLVDVVKDDVVVGVQELVQRVRERAIFACEGQREVIGMVQLDVLEAEGAR